MRYDIFFSISQTPVDGYLPSEAEMFRNFLAQVQAADAQGFGTAWIAESHLSSEVQKQNRRPVIPHWQGEVGLNANFLALADLVFRHTLRIECGSAVMNIVCMGGPVAHAERIAAHAALRGLDESDKRRYRVGFSAGRFEFMNEASGVRPRDAVEAAAWPALKGRVFAEACEVFLRLLRGDTLSSDDVAPTQLTRSLFRSDEDWQRVQSAAGTRAERIEVPNRWSFEKIKIVPQQWRRELVDLIIGSHESPLQAQVNAWQPVKVFNLSITRPEIIEDTHRRMSAAYHPLGGPWQREYMPRTTFVFLNEEPGLTPESRRAAAQIEARKALRAYWTALDGTLDPVKVENAADNALIGDAEQVAQQAVERFHRDDCLMLWFDFFNHDCARVIRNQEAWMDKVAPRIAERISESAR